MRRPLVTQELYKLHIMVDTIKWNDSNNSLAAVADGLLLVWYYPEVIYMDRESPQDPICPQNGPRAKTRLRHPFHALAAVARRPTPRTSNSNPVHAALHCHPPRAARHLPPATCRPPRGSIAALV